MPSPTRLYRVALLTCVLWAGASLCLGVVGLWQQGGQGAARTAVEAGLVALAALFAAGSFVQRLLRWHRLAVRSGVRQ